MKKRDKKLSAGDSSTISTILGGDTQIDGKFSFNDTIRVDGRINGELTSDKGTVIIGENAVVEADVLVAVAIVRGKVKGRIVAGQRIEIYAPAQVNGDIHAPTVTIDSGVIFNGKCEMQTQAGAGDPKSKPAENATEKAAAQPQNDEKNI
jgi:cytoskeletal protein CcmA (bactofilin family)